MGSLHWMGVDKSAAIFACPYRKDPKASAVLLANRAATRLKLGKYQGAEADASAAIAADKDYTKGFHRRAAALSAQGKFEVGPGRYCSPRHRMPGRYCSPRHRIPVT